MKEIKFNYRPLPNNVTIKKSKLEGLGLHATKDIKIHYIFGITHLKNVNDTLPYTRTPLGGFINHSNTPNCVVIPQQPGDDWHSCEQEPEIKESTYTLMSIKPIKEGEELTVYYSIEQ